MPAWERGAFYLVSPRPRLVSISGLGCDVDNAFNHCVHFPPPLADELALAFPVISLFVIGFPT